MSATIEIEQLQNERARLEEEAQDLDEELKQLETRWKLLSEKVAIQELKKKNAAKKEAINQLQHKIRLLETQLEKLSTTNISADAPSIDEDNENHESTIEPTSLEDAITVTALDNEEDIGEHIETEYEKKKYGFFF
ncbi:MAG: hypothetical protein ACPLKZ_04365 [Candidatus Bathyarchaeales archaeon]